MRDDTATILSKMKNPERALKAALKNTMHPGGGSSPWVPFAVKSVVSNMKVLKIEHLAKTAKATSYRVKCETCGAESIATHPYITKRIRRGYSRCNACKAEPAVAKARAKVQSTYSRDYKPLEKDLPLWPAPKSVI